MDKKKLSTIHIIALIVIIIIIAGSFYGGMLYSKNQNARSFNNGTFQTRINRAGGVNGSNFISGNIISKDSSSITLQIPNNGGSKIIFYSGTTQISKFAAGTADDLATGTTVSVTGTTNSDGSITAQSIQIRPANQNRPNQ